MKTKILRNIFISVSVLFASARLLSAGMNDGVLNFSNTPLVRPQATFITFDAPGGQRDMLPSGINPSGAITGTYITGSYVHAFLRAPDGTVTTIDPPGSTGAWVGFFQGLVGPPINPAGDITGTYFDASGVQHGFLRDKHGTITTFDPRQSTASTPRASTRRGRSQGSTLTRAARSTVSCGKHGTITTFDVPGAVGSHRR